MRSTCFAPHVPRLLCAALLFLVVADWSRAEDAATITGAGTATVKRPASRLRMSMVLTSRGKTLDEALAAMKDRRTAAAAALKKLGASESSVEFGDAQLVPAGGAQSQAERMMRVQVSRGGRAPKGLELPQSTSLTCTLKAEWTLKYASHDELLVLVKRVQDLIAAADLAGLKEPKNLTPEEKELEEELAGADSGYSSYRNEEQKTPGEPSYTFIADIPPEERKAALASAFAQAKDKAGELATAAGLKLGGLVELSDQMIEDSSAYAYAYSRRYGQEPSTDPNESVSPQPGMVTMQVMVRVKFRAQ